MSWDKGLTFQHGGACLGHCCCLGCSRCAFRSFAHTHCDYRVRVAVPGLVLMPILLPLLEVHLLAMRVHICIRVESLRAMRACVQHLARVRGHVFLSLQNIRAYLHNDYFCIYVFIVQLTRSSLGRLKAFSHMGHWCERAVLWEYLM